MLFVQKLFQIFAKIENIHPIYSKFGTLSEVFLQKYTENNIKNRAKSSDLLMTLDLMLVGLTFHV